MIEMVCVFYYKNKEFAYGVNVYEKVYFERDIVTLVKFERQQFIEYIKRHKWQMTKGFEIIEDNIIVDNTLPKIDIITDMKIDYGYRLDNSTLVSSEIETECEQLGMYFDSYDLGIIESYTSEEIAIIEGTKRLETELEKLNITMFSILEYQNDNNDVEFYLEDTKTLSRVFNTFVSIVQYGYSFEVIAIRYSITIKKR